MIKKLIGFIIIVSLLTSLQLVVYSENEIYDFSKDNAQYEYDLLVHLGIFTPEDYFEFNPNYEINRGEFVRLVVGLIGGPDDELSLPQSPFLDVTRDDEIYPYLEKALKFNIISEGKYFLADESISLEQIAKMLVVALGYEAKAQLLGGWPYGYTKVANEIKLFSNMSFSKDILWADALTMICRALETPVLDVSSVGDGITFSTNKEKTPLSVYLKLKKIEGILNTNSKISLFDADHIIANQIKVGDIVCKTESKFADQFLGMLVNAYLEAEDEILVSIAPTLNKNNILKVDDVEILDNQADTRNFSYEKNEKEETVKLSPNVYFIYNNVPCDMEVSLLHPANGFVNLIDNNGDKAYDVVIVKEYEPYIIKSYSAVTEKIYDKLDKEITLNRENTTLVFPDGSIAAEKELKEGNIANIIEYHMKGEAYFDVIINNDYIIGEITETGDDFISIDDEEFDTGLSFEAIRDTQHPLTKCLELGTMVAAYFDVNGRIGAVINSEFSSGGVLYGWLKDYNKKTSLSKELSLEIFNTQSEWIIFECTKKNKA